MMKQMSKKYIENVLYPEYGCTQFFDSDGVLIKEVVDTGDVRIFVNGVFRELICTNGSYMCFDEQKRPHAEGKPACYWVNNGKINTYRWYNHGILSRDPKDGPACLDIDGSYTYSLNGVRHRDDGPAVCSRDTKDSNVYIYQYFSNGNLIREEKKKNDLSIEDN